MKILKTGGILVLAAATVFFGTHVFWGARNEEKTSEAQEEREKQYLEEVAFYQDLAVSLEESLSQLKEENYAARVAYEARIAELENRLKESEPPSSEVIATPSIPYTYAVSDGGITITSYLGQDMSVSIPAHIEGLPVVEIGRDAFRHSAVHEVILPGTLKRIDWFAFYQSHLLERVSIPSSVTKIEYGAFDGCDRVTVFCEKDSYADRYARSFSMRVVNG